MSNEMLQKTIDLVSSLEVKNETQQTAKYELIEYTERLHKENQELKKQLETIGKKYEFESKTRDKLYKMLRIKDTQQKEFIEWLEQNIENEEYCYLAQNPSERCRKDVFEEVLSKYKEIIGV